MLDARLMFLCVNGGKGGGSGVGLGPPDESSTMDRRGGSCGPEESEV
jgi:hypothetical protein